MAADKAGEMASDAAEKAGADYGSTKQAVEAKVEDVTKDADGSGS
jgi:hypothetical protein